MALKEVEVITSPNWRLSFFQKILKTSQQYLSPNKSASQAIPSIRTPEFVQESLTLPSSRRLYGLAQNDPTANRLLGLDLTRGGHTEDAVKLSFLLLTIFTNRSPDVINEFAQVYGMHPEELILHAAEYIRLHDSATLAFQGATHGKVKIAGAPYDEDTALIAALQGDPNYSEVREVVHDSSTEAFYQTRGIQMDAILRIAVDAVEGNNTLGLFLKGGHGTAPNIDWIAYSLRDYYELLRVFNIDFNLPFGERIIETLDKINNVSESLASSTPLDFTVGGSVKKPSIENLLPENFVRLERIDGRPQMVYDGQAVLELYLTHIFLRLFFSGSPWIRGIYSIISDFYLKQNNIAQDELYRHLLQHSEEKLLATDLKNALPVGDLNTNSLSSPSSIPAEIKGWRYAGKGNRVRFVFKDIGSATVDLRGEISTFRAAFPEVTELADKVRNQKISLSLNKDL